MVVVSHPSFRCFCCWFGLVWLSLLRPCVLVVGQNSRRGFAVSSLPQTVRYRKAFPNIMEKRKFGRKLLYQCSSESIIVHCFTVGSVCLVECIDGYPPKQRASSLVIIYLLPWMILRGACFALLLDRRGACTSSFQRANHRHPWPPRSNTAEKNHLFTSQLSEQCHLMRNSLV